MDKTLQRSNNPEFETNCPMIELTHSDIRGHLQILHVDDDQCFLDVSKQILSMENNFDVDTAESVEKALEKMGKKAYDVIVSDYEMPQKNGLDFLKELRSNKNDIPFILLTGKGREEIITNALNMGVDRYINKNGSPESVYCELANAIIKVAENEKAKQLLIESEMKYRTVVEKSLQGVLISIINPLKIIFVNNTIAKILGYSIQELLSLSQEAIEGLVFKDDRVVLCERLQKRFQGEGTKDSFEFRAVRKDGSTVWLEVFSNHIEYNGQLAVLSMFLDIDERKKAEQALRTSEEHLKELANLFPEMIFEYDLTGKVTFINQKTMNFSGFTREELIGKSIIQFLVPEDRERAIENTKMSLTGKDLGLNEYRFFKKDGTIYPALVRTSRILCENKAIGLRGLIVDISERKKMEKTQQESIRDENTRDILNLLTDMTVVVDEKGLLMHVNDVFEQETGLNQKEIIGKSFLEVAILPPESKKMLLENLKKRLQGLPIQPYEVLFIDVTGKSRWVEVKGKKVNYSGKLVDLVVFHDVTRRREDEQRLKEYAEKMTMLVEEKVKEIKESEEKFKSFTEQSPNIIFVNKNGRVAYANKKAEVMGYTIDELYSPNFNFLCLIAPSSRDKIRSIFETHMKDGGDIGPVEYSLVKKDGKVFDAMLTSSIIKYEGANAILGTVIDVTERKKAIETLVFQSELLEAVGQALIATDMKRIIRYWNKAAKNLFGFSAEEALGKTIDELLPSEFCQDQLDKLSERLISGESWFGETDIVNHDGNLVSVIVTHNPVLNKDGKFIGAISVYTDISDQKNMELELKSYVEEYAIAEDKIQKLNEKLRVVGSLTRHDVRNKLGVLDGYVYMLKKKFSKNQEALKYITKMDEASKQLLAILESEKVYEQIGSEELTYVSVERLFLDASGWVSDFKGIKIECKCNGLEVLADSLLRQLLYNLMDNTLKYGEKTSLIKLYSKKDGDSIQLIFEDNGVGMTDEVRSHLFEKGFGKGTGLGLYMIKRIIEAYGWSIEENGKLGIGAKFTMKIPENRFRLKEKL